MAPLQYLDWPPPVRQPCARHTPHVGVCQRAPRVHMPGGAGSLCRHIPCYSNPTGWQPQTYPILSKSYRVSQWLINGLSTACAD
eukprot:366430-Chlamydomonas_euryale.AAC.8